MPKNPEKPKNSKRESTPEEILAELGPLPTNNLKNKVEWLKEVCRRLPGGELKASYQKEHKKAKKELQEEEQHKADVESKRVIAETLKQSAAIPSKRNKGGKEKSLKNEGLTTEQVVEQMVGSLHASPEEPLAEESGNMDNAAVLEKIATIDQVISRASSIEEVRTATLEIGRLMGKKPSEEAEEKWQRYISPIIEVVSGRASPETIPRSATRIKLTELIHQNKAIKEPILEVDPNMPAAVQRLVKSQISEVNSPAKSPQPEIVSEAISKKINRIVVEARTIDELRTNLGTELLVEENSRKERAFKENLLSSMLVYIDRRMLDDNADFPDGEVKEIIDELIKEAKGEAEEKPVEPPVATPIEPEAEVAEPKEDPLPTAQDPAPVEEAVEAPLPVEDPTPPPVTQSTDPFDVKDSLQSEVPVPPLETRSSFQNEAEPANTAPKNNPPDPEKKSKAVDADEIIEPPHVKKWRQNTTASKTASPAPNTVEKEVSKEEQLALDKIELPQMISESEALMQQARDNYMAQLLEDKKIEKQKPWRKKFGQLARRATVGVWEDLGFKERALSYEAGILKKEYDNAKKSYGNAIANLHWIEAREKAGDVPLLLDNPKKGKKGEPAMIKNPAYAHVEAQIAKDLLTRLAIPEYQKLKAQGLESQSAKEKSIAKKVLDLFRNPKTRTARYILTGLAVTGLAVSAGVALPGAALLGGTSVARSLLAGSVGGMVAKKSFGFFGQKAEQKRKGRESHLEKEYSIITGVNAYNESEELAEIDRVRSLFKSAGLAMVTSIGSSSAVFEAAETINFDSPKASPSVSQTIIKPSIAPLTPPALDIEPAPSDEIEYDPQPLPPVELDTRTPVELDTRPIQVKNTLPLAETAPIEPSLDNLPSELVSSDTYGKLAPDQIEVPSPEEITIEKRVHVSENIIKDRRVGGKIIHDSGELSLRKELEANAEKLGFKREEGWTDRKWYAERKKWAIEELEARIAEDPSIRAIRNAVTHDGNKSVLVIHEDGSWKAHLEQGTGRKIGNYKIDLATEEIATEPEAGTEKLTIDTGVIPVESELTFSHEDESTLIELERERLLSEITPLKSTDPLWEKGFAKVKMHELAHTKSVPEFVRSHDLISPENGIWARLFGGDHFQKSVTVARNLRELAAQGTSMGIAPHTHESVDAYTHRFIKSVVEKNIKEGNTEALEAYRSMIS